MLPLKFFQRNLIQLLLLETAAAGTAKQLESPAYSPPGLKLQQFDHQPRDAWKRKAMLEPRGSHGALPTVQFTVFMFLYILCFPISTCLLAYCFLSSL